MTTNTTIRRRIAAFAVAAIVFPAFGACGTEISAPAQDIGASKVQKQERSVRMPTTRPRLNRFDLEDAHRTAKVQKQERQVRMPTTRPRLNRYDVEYVQH